MLPRFLALFGWSFLAASVLPLGSEPALILLVREGHPLLWLIAVATAGNYLGACTTYGLALAAVRHVSGSKTSPRQERALRLIGRFGAPVMLLSWVPLLGDVLVGAAGAVRMPFARFSIWILIGKAARYGGIAWAALQI